MVHDDGTATDNFIEWAEATSHLVDENWKYGFDRIAMKMSADLANNKDPWPPTTPRIFVAMCFPPEVPNHLKVNTAGASKMSHTDFKDPSHPYYTPVKGIESDDMKARKSEAEKKAMSEMLKGL